jgi:hypothetical protein
MRIALILALAAPVALFLLLRWFAGADPQRVARGLRTALFVVAGLGLLYLVASGRLNWLFAALGAAVPIILRLVSVYRAARGLGGLGGGRGGATGAGAGGAGRTSEVSTRFLRMELDHDSGEMRGEILDGRFRGRQIVELDRGELIELLDECRAADEESAALLEAYLDRVYADWRAAAGRGEEDRQGPGNGSAPMSENEARAVLGVGPGAGREEIVDAHRRLMQKLHPDRGGSDYLAARVNQAKRLLLGD